MKCMSRDEQFEILENLFVWDIEEVGHFSIAFYAHYQILNDMLENCAERFRNIGIPRVDYLVYKEYIYIIYTQLCVTIETLLKSLMEENGYSEREIRKNGHDLNMLLAELRDNDVPKINMICKKLQLHKDIIDYLMNDNIFVEARYMAYKEELSFVHINKIKELLLDLDSIFEEHYGNCNWVDIVYPDTM